MELKLWGRLHEREDGTYRAVKIGRLATSDASWNWRVTDLYVDDAAPSASVAGLEQASMEAVASRDALVNRAEDLHLKAHMPWRQAEELALEEIGFTDDDLRELIGEAGASGDCILTREELERYTRSVLVHGSPYILGDYAESRPGGFWMAPWEPDAAMFDAAKYDETFMDAWRSMRDEAIRTGTAAPFGWHYQTNYMATYEDHGFTQSPDMAELLRNNDRYIVTPLYERPGPAALPAGMWLAPMEPDTEMIRAAHYWEVDERVREFWNALRNNWLSRQPTDGGAA